MFFDIRGKYDKLGRRCASTLIYFAKIFKYPWDPITETENANGTYLPCVSVVFFWIPYSFENMTMTMPSLE